MFLIISGLPASGKTTLGKALAKALNLPFLDKDDILESLFDSLGCKSADERSRLSRASDSIFQKSAESTFGAVLVSFWRSAGAHNNSGTPTRWLTELSSHVIEIYCDCDPVTCTTRFANRERHPGHFDKEKKKEEVLVGFKQLYDTGPLGVAKLITVNTAEEFNIASLLAEIQKRTAEG